MNIDTDMDMNTDMGMDTDTDTRHGHKHKCIGLCEVDVVMSSMEGMCFKWETVGEREKGMGRKGGGVSIQPTRDQRGRDSRHDKGGIPSK
jgi:hypothetical protein